MTSIFQTKEAGRGLVVFGSVLRSSAGPAGLAGQGWTNPGGGPTCVRGRLHRQQSDGNPQGLSEEIITCIDIKVVLLNPYQALTFIKQLVLIIWMSFISGFIKNWYCWVIYKMMINLLCGFICRHSSMNWGPAQTQWLLSEREPRKCWTNLNMTWHSSKLSLSSLPQCGIECVSWAWTSRRS